LGATLVALAFLAGNATAATAEVRVEAAGALADVQAPEVPQAQVPALPGVDLPAALGNGEPVALPLGGPLAAQGEALLPTSVAPGVPEFLAKPEVQAAAGAGVVASLAVAAAARPLMMALGPLYSRLEKGELLNHPARRELMRLIAADPGINISDLHGTMSMGWGSLLYHLQRLEAQGFVVSHRWGRSRRYFLNQRSVESRAEGIRALKADNARALAELVVSQPGSTQEQLASAMQLSKSVVSKYAKRLEDASLVQRQVGRNCLRLFPTGELRELLHGHAALPAPGNPPVLSPPTPQEAPAREGPSIAATA
jgi:DNA-binding MarR family transcriptional regulator